MELDVKEDNKNKMVFRIKGEDNTLCNIFVNELNNDESVKHAGYFMEHPLIADPQVVVETKTGTPAKTAIVDAVKRIKKENEKFLKSFNKI